MTLNIMVEIFGWMASVYFLLCLLWTAHAWIVTSPLYPKSMWRNSVVMVTIVARSQVLFFLWIPIFLLACTIVTFYVVSFFVETFEVPFIFVLSIFLWGAHALVYQALPPSVLLLGSSRHETIQLRHKLERALYPYRVVVLLEPESVETKNDSLFARNLFAYDNLRTSEKLWRSIVFRLLETVPAIVIDSRVATKGVVEEIRYITAHGLVEKALFVSDNQSTAPALAVAKVEVQMNSIVRDTKVASTLKRMCLRHTTSPDDNPLLKRIGKG